ncbi:methionine gamma-lyase family protein [Tepidibacillus sp. HK-1]|uniref:methionine gamma-lyase family protein n=1 Tax=Tepidibacillus sp. HK-1 TaxID=1883407 RepID=UPI000853911E|nr:methionine gamma-lyase family protein [Tepidibacillus sp. HK-1]GBF11346.1 methionine gamma-lyase [Tepidibacillus sp. HK-1]
MFSFFKYGKEFERIVIQVEKQISTRIQEIDQIASYNQGKVLKAFQNHHVSDFHLLSSTGYGYDDMGRDMLDQIYADVFEAEAGLVRPHIVSGTHALSIGLFGLLRPGDELLYITGDPYDTLEEVIGIHGEGMGSLKEWGITYQSVPLTKQGKVNFVEVAKKINQNTKVIAIQRSRGYSWRSSFSIEEIKEMVTFVKEIKPDLITFVDNCYGEFTEKQEPTGIGVDVIVGSLIKNPGGGLAKTGGYIVGKKVYIEKISYRLTAPGIGAKVGSMHGHMADFYQGFFLAPHFVGEALKGSIFAAALFEQLGFETNPSWNEARHDIIQAVKFNNTNTLITFLQGIQKGSPIDSHVIPVPNQIPGYQDSVIMAAGTFIQGASLELSGDAPIRSPYIAYVQGGLTYHHVKWGILTAIEMMVDKGILSIA